MQRIAILLLLLTSFIFGQNKYFLPIKIEQSNGRPINDANVDLYTAGTSTKVYDLTYLDNTAGAYYYTSAITTGFYDIYVNGRSWKTYVYINSSNQNTSTIALATIQAADTTELKAMTAYGDTATYRYLQKRVSTDPATKVKLIGAGFFVQGDSTEMMTKFGTATADGGAIFANAGTAKRWYRAELDYSKDIPVSWYGNTHAALNSAITLASTLKGRVIVEDTVTVTDTVTIKSNTHIIGTGKRNYIKRGSGFTATMFDITASVSNVRIEGVNFNLGGSGALLVETTNTFDGLTIIDCTFDSLYSVGNGFIQLSNSTGNNDIRVERNNFTATDYQAALTIDGITRGWFLSNNFHGTSLKIEGNLKDIFITDCKFDSVDQSNLFLRFGTSDTIWNIHVKDNTFNECSWQTKTKGAIVYGEGGSGNQYARYASITGNIINGHYGSGIGVGASGYKLYDVEISDNIIHGGVEADTAHQKRDTWGINIIDTERFEIVNNQIYSEGTSGIIINGADSGLVAGNHVKNCGRDTTETDHRKVSCINLASGSKNITVTNNVVEDCGNSVADGAADAKASGIALSRSTSGRLDTINVSYNTIRDTRSSRWTKYGVHIDELANDTQLPQNLQIIGNNCVGVDSIPVYMDSILTRTSVDEWRIYDNIGDSLTWNLTNARFIRAYETDNSFIFPGSAGDTALVTLTDAAKGMRFNFFNLNSTHTLQVDPQADDSIQVNAAGKYAELHPGASMSIECFSNNKWTITKSSWSSSTAADSISFQP